MSYDFRISSNIWIHQSLACFRNRTMRWNFVGWKTPYADRLIFIRHESGHVNEFCFLPTATTICLFSFLPVYQSNTCEYIVNMHIVLIQRRCFEYYFSSSHSQLNVMCPSFHFKYIYTALGIYIVRILIRIEVTNISKEPQWMCTTLLIQDASVILYCVACCVVAALASWRVCFVLRTKRKPKQNCCRSVIESQSLVSLVRDNFV